MMSINETINRELGADRYSYIEVYDVDTDVLIYHGWAWDCPYTTYIVKDYQAYNANNKVCFKMWVDCGIGELESAIDDYMNSIEDEEETETEANIIIHGEAEDFFFYTWEEPELI